jgi:hypothetical protein
MGWVSAWSCIFRVPVDALNHSEYIHSTLQYTVEKNVKKWCMDIVFPSCVKIWNPNDVWNSELNNLSVEYFEGKLLMVNYTLKY